MGSDDLFNKRRERSLRHLERSGSKRSSYDYVLIVCEGSKTEPNYLRELQDDLELNSANIVITGECGSDPVSVVSHAKKMYKQDTDYDRVYCVFDRDQHPNYESAMNMLRNLRPEEKFFPITSTPCFEYWLLLHFLDTAKPFVSQGRKSSCQCLISELKGFLTDYAKGNSKVYWATKSHLEDAMVRARRNRNLIFAGGSFNPHTRLDELVDYLRNLK